jgi:hypothetical protein
MERHEVIDARLEMRVVDDEKICVFAPSATAMGQCCLALTLIERDLVSSVAFEAGERQFLVVSVDRSIQPAVGALAKWSPPTVHFRLSTNSLEHWLAFALKYHRDGVGDVEHIDIEARSTPAGRADTVLVFQVPSSKKSLSPKQAKKKIGSFDD